MLGYVYMPVLQRKCDIFVNNWSNHRVRNQKELTLPTVVPNRLLSSLQLEQSKEVAKLLGVLTDQDVYIDNGSFQLFKQCVPMLESFLFY